MDLKQSLKQGYYEKMMDMKEAYWEAAEKIFERFFFPDAKLEKAFYKEKEELLNRYISEFYYAYVYEPYYVVSDLKNWTYEQLMTWVDNNVDEINQICRECYKGDWTDLKKRSK